MVQGVSGCYSLSAFLKMQMEKLEMALLCCNAPVITGTCLSAPQKPHESALINACKMLGDPRMVGANELQKIITLLQNMQPISYSRKTCILASLLSCFWKHILQEEVILNGKKVMNKVEGLLMPVLLLRKQCFFAYSIFFLSL